MNRSIIGRWALRGCFCMMGMMAGPTHGVAEAFTVCTDGRTAPNLERYTGSATFTIERGDAAETYEFTSGTQLVFCRRTSETMVWVRFAASADGDGGDDVHLDIDLCNVTTTDTFRAMNARANPCPGGPTWAVWWHDREKVAFANGPTATGCELALTVAGSDLIGTFACTGLTAADGSESVNVVNGSFRCTLDPLPRAGADPVDRRR